MLKSKLPLGRKVSYADKYDPSLLYPIERIEKRCELGLIEPASLPFYGFDVWHAYELSWLSAKGLPQVAIGRFTFDAAAKYLVESKSLKLYLNSFNNTKFASSQQVQQILANDLTNACGLDVKIELFSLDTKINFASNSGILLDELDIEFEIPKDVDSSHLQLEEQVVSQRLYTHLFKSNCLVTNQPDWASLFIEYHGNKINHQGLLKYLLSYRNHQGFHEHCIEKVYMDLSKLGNFEYLSVFGKYTRRGGLDILPYRASNLSKYPDLSRELRQ